jgi:hypothetical protein
MAIIEIDNAYIIEHIKFIHLSNPLKFSVQKISLENIMDSSSFNDENTILKFKEFLMHGHMGFYCYLNQECILRLWFFNKSDVAFVGRHFLYILDNSEYFFGWSETKENSRGKGAYPFTLYTVLKELKNERVTAFISNDNLSSLNGVKKAGFEVARKFYLIKISKIKLQIEYYRMNRKLFFSIRIGHKIKSIDVNEKI